MFSPNRLILDFGRGYAFDSDEEATCRYRPAREPTRLVNVGASIFDDHMCQEGVGPGVDADGVIRKRLARDLPRCSCCGRGCFWGSFRHDRSRGLKGFALTFPALVLAFGFALASAFAAAIFA